MSSFDGAKYRLFCDNSQECCENVIVWFILETEFLLRHEVLLKWWIWKSLKKNWWYLVMPLEYQHFQMVGLQASTQ